MLNTCAYGFRALFILKTNSSKRCKARMCYDLSLIRFHAKFGKDFSWRPYFNVNNKLCQIYFLNKILICSEILNIFQFSRNYKD